MTCGTSLLPPKARLCFVGIEQREGDGSFTEIFSTCVRYPSIRLVIALGATRGWVLFNVDIKGAYLNAKMDTELYMREPPGYETEGGGQCLLLKRALYGAKQSGHLWRKELDGWLRRYGFEPTIHDDCVYVLRDAQSGISMMIGVWVDDIVGAAADDEVHRRFVADLSRAYQVDDRGLLQWALGMRVDYDRQARRVTLSGAGRIRELGELYGTDLRTSRKVSTPADAAILDLADGEPLTREGAERAQRLIGALIYIATTTRPDVAHAVYRCAVYMSKPNRRVWSAALRVLVYLLHTAEAGITYDGMIPGRQGLSAQSEGPAPAGEREILQALSDANWEVARSITGYYLSLAGAAFAWAGKRQPSTALSSTEAETFAASAAAAEVLWARGLMGELGAPQLEPTTLWVDNKGAVAIANDRASVGRSRHIARRANFLLEAAASGAIRLRWVDTNAMVADILTKPLDARRFATLRDTMMGQRGQQ